MNDQLAMAIQQARESGKLVKIGEFATPRIPLSNTLGRLLVEGYRAGDSRCKDEAIAAVKEWLTKYVQSLVKIYLDKLASFGQEIYPESIELAKNDMSSFLDKQIEGWNRDLVQNRLFAIGWMNAIANDVVGHAKAMSIEIQAPLWLDACHLATARSISKTPKPALTSTRPVNKKIAVIYGRDSSAFDCIVSAIKLCGLKPYPFNISKLNHAKIHEGTFEIVTHMLEQTVASVIIFSPDEEARLRSHLCSSDDEAKARYQPRQNVILEYGMALASHKNNILVMTFGDVDFPSDMAFVHRNHWNSGDSAIDFMYEKFKRCQLPVGKKPSKKTRSKIEYIPNSNNNIASESEIAFSKLVEYTKSLDSTTTDQYLEIWKEINKFLDNRSQPESIRRGSASSFAYKGYWKLIRERGDQILNAAESLEIALNPDDDRLLKLLFDHPYSSYFQKFMIPHFRELLNFNEIVIQNMRNEALNRQPNHWKSEIETRRRNSLLKPSQ